MRPRTRIEYRLLLEGSASCGDTSSPIRTVEEAIKLDRYWREIGRSRSAGQTGRVVCRVVSEWVPLGAELPGDLTYCPSCGEEIATPECDECAAALAEDPS